MTPSSTTDEVVVVASNPTVVAYVSVLDDRDDVATPLWLLLLFRLPAEAEAEAADAAPPDGI